MACVAAAVVGCASTGNSGAASTTASTWSAARDPLPVMEAVADWQLTNMKGPEAYPAKAWGGTWEPRGWVQGVFYAGLADLASRSHEPRFAAAVMDHGAAQSWKLGDRQMHADDQVIGQSYLWVYSRTHDPAVLAPMRAKLDAVLANPPHVSLDFDAPGDGHERACQARWCWSDALFMAPASWVGLSAATGDPRYLAYADAEFWATTDALYDRDEHLYYRDSRFIRQRDERGRKIFWSRGNGWVFAGIARVLDSLPPNHPSRARYEDLMREMAARLVTLQEPSGYWPASLLAADLYTKPETSGTGFFVYGLAWGLNHHVLNGAEYRRAVDRGWDALVRAVAADGRLGWVQQIGDSPKDVTAQDTQFYGAGAFLLAGGQVRELRKQQPN
jgi:rhamnogalacturonyl hydrolase YesR